MKKKTQSPAFTVLLVVLLLLVMLVVAEVVLMLVVPVLLLVAVVAAVVTVAVTVSVSLMSFNAWKSPRLEQNISHQPLAQISWPLNNQL